jgi:hypothetical protein
MKDKLVKAHRKGSYYKARNFAIGIITVMMIGASVAVPISLLSVDAIEEVASSEVIVTSSSELI